MALKGEAKKLYQREYMKDYQRKRRGSKQGLNNNDGGSKQSKLEAMGLILQGNKIVGLTKKAVQPIETIPIYNPAAHKAGDKVLVEQGKRLKEIIIPTLDADGNSIPDYD